MEKKVKKEVKKLSKEGIIEQTYQTALKLMESIPCMQTSYDKADMYERAGKKFDSISEYQDSSLRANQCIELAKEVRAQMESETYAKAKQYKKKAKNADDYKSAAEEFRKISKYKDSGNKAVECDEKRMDLVNKEGKKNIFRKGVYAVVLLVIVVSLLSPFAKYNIARVIARTGSYATAMKLYDGLGSYKDSKSRKYEMEKRRMAHTEVGKSVEINEYKWRVLEKHEDRVLLVKESVIMQVPYNKELENTTWENSSLRKYLNSRFLERTFTKLQRKDICRTQLVNDGNEVYNTNGGEDTNDRIFVLSAKEAKQYEELLPKFANDSWLRTPGITSDRAAFLTSSGKVMDNGYEVTSKEVRVYPALWYKIK